MESVVLDKEVEQSLSGIDRDKVSTLKTDIVAYEGRIKNIFNDIEDAASDVGLCIDGDGKRTFNSVYSKIKASNDIVIKNVDLHIDELNSAVNLFENQDLALAQSVKTEIM